MRYQTINEDDLKYLNNKGVEVTVFREEDTNIVFLDPVNGKKYFEPLVRDWLMFRDSVKSGDLADDFEFFLNWALGGYGLYEGDLNQIKQSHITYDNVQDYIDHPYEHLDNPVYDLDTVVRQHLAKMAS